MSFPDPWFGLRERQPDPQGAFGAGEEAGVLPPDDGNTAVLGGEPAAFGDPVNPQTGTYQWDGWGTPYNSDYKYMGGTSMSNPIAAGAATVVRDYYNKAKSLPNASAALIKATLINSAVDMADENNDGVNDNDFPIPNVHEGWGRINLDPATDGTIAFVENNTGLSTSGAVNYTITPTGGPLKVTLVWSDYPSTEATTGANLVNNLNLTGTSGTNTYRDFDVLKHIYLKHCGDAAK